MIRLMVRMQRPHCALQPRQRWTCTAERGVASTMAVRTWLSESTLQEQTIMARRYIHNGAYLDRRARNVLQKENDSLNEFQSEYCIASIE